MPTPDPPISPQEVDRRRAHRLAFADVVRRARNDAGLTQEALADLAELSRPTVARIENGSHSVSLDRLWALSTALHIPASELIARTEARAMELNENVWHPR